MTTNSMFDEDEDNATPRQPCEDCGKKYIRENLIEERSRAANYKLFCIRCYNRRKNEKNDLYHPTDPNMSKLSR
jgi:formylmethanofuran dehydrogenase subunit E|tara:strand:+ start:298 stop:519 length:222 start_codon:yes stop_codon:yes gene_type:complete